MYSPLTYPLLACTALLVSLLALFLAFGARQSYGKAATLLETTLMTVQDLATHLTPLLGSAKDVVADNASLLTQLQAANAASGADNTLVDQVITSMDSVTASLTAAHAAVTAATTATTSTTAPAA